MFEMSDLASSRAWSRELHRCFHHPWSGRPGDWRVVVQLTGTNETLRYLTPASTTGFTAMEGINFILVFLHGLLRWDPRCLHHHKDRWCRRSSHHLPHHQSLNPHLIHHYRIFTVTVSFTFFIRLISVFPVTLTIFCFFIFGVNITIFFIFITRSLLRCWFLWLLRRFVQWIFITTSVSHVIRTIFYEKNLVTWVGIYFFTRSLVWRRRASTITLTWLTLSLLIGIRFTKARVITLLKLIHHLICIRIVVNLFPKHTQKRKFINRVLTRIIDFKGF